MNTINEVSMLAVSTIAQVAPQGYETIIASTRETKKTGTISEENKRRSIVVPEYSLQGLAVPSKFESILLTQIREIAKSQLSELWENDANLREVPAAIWTIDSLLMYAARKAESTRLTSAGVEAWYEASNLAKRVASTGNAAVIKDWKLLICGLAAPNLAANLRYTIAQCDTLLVSISKSDDDAESTIGKQLLTKITRHQEAMRKALQDVAPAEAI